MRRRFLLPGKDTAQTRGKHRADAAEKDLTGSKKVDMIYAIRRALFFSLKSPLARPQPRDMEES